jgi:hypothetical protein
MGVAIFPGKALQEQIKEKKERQGGKIKNKYIVT